MTDADAARMHYTVAFCTKTSRIIDIIPNGVEATAVLAKLTPEYGDALIELAPGEAKQRYEATFKSNPQEITREKFDDMLNVLPPVAWTSDGDGESFKISERLAGCVTAIYVRINDRYATFHDDIRTSHRDCCRRAFEYFADPKCLLQAETHVHQ